MSDSQKLADHFETEAHKQAAQRDADRMELAVTATAIQEAFIKAFWHYNSPINHQNFKEAIAIDSFDFAIRNYGYESLKNQQINALGAFLVPRVKEAKTPKAIIDAITSAFNQVQSLVLNPRTLTGANNLLALGADDAFNAANLDVHKTLVGPCYVQAQLLQLRFVGIIAYDENRKANMQQELADGLPFAVPTPSK